METDGTDMVALIARVLNSSFVINIECSIF
jgi:hypothetical protein